MAAAWYPAPVVGPVAIRRARPRNSSNPVPRCGACSGRGRWLASWPRDAAAAHRASSTAATGSTRRSRSGSPRTTSATSRGLLRLDGSPPLFYLLLHGWMAVVGHERGRHARAVAAVRAAGGAGLVVGGQRGLRPARGRARRGGRGRLPVPDLLRAGDADVLAGRRAVGARLRELRARVRARPAAARLAARAVARAAALRAQLGALPRRRDGRRAGCGCGARAGSAARDGALLAAGVALVVRAVGAEPRSSRPRTPRRRGRRGRRRCRCSASPACLFGFVAVPLLALGAGAALRRAPAAEGARLLALIGGVAGAARVPRLAARAGVGAALPRDPVRAAAARARRGALARARAGRGCALAGVVVVWLASGPPPAKSNVRTVAAHGRAGAAARRPRRLHPARAGAGARTATCRRRPALPHAARAGRRAAADRLARRSGAAARRAAERVLAPR